MKGADESRLHLFKSRAYLLPYGVDLVAELLVVLVQRDKRCGQNRDDGDHDTYGARQRSHGFPKQAGDLRRAGDDLHHGADILDHLTDSGDELAAHQEYRTDSGSDSGDLDDGVLGLIIQAGQPVHNGGDLLNRFLDHGSQTLAKGDGKALHC